ncbi:hypothetical protein JX266_010573 [Neoarthrinium moseri]|nr:hypothetical protein JX266_010573 [Neoarthrinium moseri]
MSDQTAKITSIEPLDSKDSKWLKLVKINYEDKNGKLRTWEAMRRPTKPKTSAVDAIQILAILDKEDGPEVILEKQFRPPTGKVVVEFPAGMVDEGETPEQAAVRELREETGFVGTVIAEERPVHWNSPASSSSCVYMIRMNIDLTKPENRNPKPELEEGEFIETFTVPLKDLYAECRKLHAQGYAIDGKVGSFAEALELTNEYQSLFKLRESINTRKPRCRPACPTFITMRRAAIVDPHGIPSCPSPRDRPFLHCPTTENKALPPCSPGPPLVTIMSTPASSARQKRPKKPKAANAIEAAVTSFLVQRPPSPERDVPVLISQAPKRWTIYEPMVLLPAGSFSSPQWTEFLNSLPEPEASDLWAAVLAQISRTASNKTPLTHLAANEGIPLHLQDGAEDAEETENVLRSPSGLRVLHGDFGAARLGGATPGLQDFAAAFWVSTRQNGIYQTWAPRWTMFSRGNISEKARLLGFHSPSPSDSVGRSSQSQHRVAQSSELRDRYAVDLYAGIGYFVFSYAKLGLRVLCWELNPWSVEGLRRGAIGNGWDVRVLQGEELSSIDMRGVLRGKERIVVFLEDNAKARERLAQVDALENDSEVRGDGDVKDAVEVLHVNCGFLPTSEPVWRDAWEMARQKGADKAWLHLHENVGVNDIEARKGEIQRLFESYKGGDHSRDVSVEHVELVKTFAPGVWHCVFDVYVYSRTSSRPT